MKNYTKLSKFISLILRHKPEEVGITLDKFGWTSVDDLLEKLKGTSNEIDMKDLELIVFLDDKRRYSFSPDKKLIRANYGHSVPVSLDSEPVTPPPYLFHGTSIRAMENIREEGILPMDRNYVHMSSNINTAASVGKRHAKNNINDVAVICISTKEMIQDGFEFYISNGTWMTKSVPQKYFFWVAEIGRWNQTGPVYLRQGEFGHGTKRSIPVQVHNHRTKKQLLGVRSY
jgi:putative RNA 2'-phosphotransferase